MVVTCNGITSTAPFTVTAKPYVAMGDSYSSGWWRRTARARGAAPHSSPPCMRWLSQCGIRMSENNSSPSSTRGGGIARNARVPCQTYGRPGCSIATGQVGDPVIIDATGPAASRAAARFEMHADRYSVVLRSRVVQRGLRPEGSTTDHRTRRPGADRPRNAHDTEPTAVDAGPRDPEPR
jgi:hypothetical protein